MGSILVLFGGELDGFALAMLKAFRFVWFVPFALRRSALENIAL